VEEIKSITSKQAKEIDTKATQELGISTLVMMENAGIRIADFVLEILNKKPIKDVAVFCGKGNNAGDGLVVSRQLICEGIDVDTFLFAPAYSLSSITRKNLRSLKKITKRIWQIKTERELERIKFSSYSILIDAIFGIGLKGQVEGIFKAVIQHMNSSGGTIVSIDIPSGLDANKGCAKGTAVKANYTLTLMAPKKGLLINQGPRFTGKLIVRHLGFPA
jgi:NAD(P)H-hydrate epimerase